MSSRGKGDQAESEVFCNKELKDSNCPVIHSFREVPLALWKWLKSSEVGQCSGKPQESRWTAGKDTVCGHYGENQNKPSVTHLSCRSVSSHPQNKHMCIKCFPLSRREILERWLMSNLFNCTLAHVWLDLSASLLGRYWIHVLTSSAPGSNLQTPLQAAESALHRLL